MPAETRAAPGEDFEVVDAAAARKQQQTVDSYKERVAELTRKVELHEKNMEFALQGFAGLIVVIFVCLLVVRLQLSTAFAQLSDAFAQINDFACKVDKSEKLVLNVVGDRYAGLLAGGMFVAVVMSMYALVALTLKCVVLVGRLSKKQA